MRTPEPPARRTAATADLVLVGVALAWGLVVAGAGPDSQIGFPSS